MANGGIPALAVLRLLVASPEPLSVGHIAKALNLSRATTYRLVEALVNEDWIKASGEPRRHQASLRVWELGAAMTAQFRTRDVALPSAIELAATVGMSTVVALYEQGEIIYTDRIDVLGDRILPVMLHGKAPSLATSSGKAILAFRPPEEAESQLETALPQLTPHTKQPSDLRLELEAIRHRGYATNEEEYILHRSAIAVPVLDASGLAVAAISIGFVGRLTHDTIERFAPKMITVAGRASSELGYRNPSFVFIS